ncbi:MAG: hypothetical protein SGILL_008431 [Bacillariaceae sp.]
MTKESTLTISNDYAESDVKFALSTQGFRDDGKRSRFSITSLFFCHVDFNDAVLEALNALNGSTYKKVTLFNCRGDRFAPSLQHILSNINIHTLVLEYTEAQADGSPIFEDQHAQALSNGFVEGASSSTIRTLSLKGLARSSALGEALQEALAHSKIENFQWTNGLFGQTLVLPQANNNDESEEYAFWNHLVVGLKSCCTLKRLSIKYVEADAMMAMIMSNLNGHPSLQSISISIKDFTSDIQVGIQKLVANDGDGDNPDHVSPLQTLKLSIRGDFSSIPVLPRPTNTNQQFKYILELYFSSDQQMEALGEGLNRNETVEEVRMRYNVVSSAGLVILGSWLEKENTKLRRLYMDGRSIEEEGGKALLNAVKKNRSRLEVVELPIGSPYRLEIQHYADLNLAGWSRILRSEKTSELSVWPTFLERANTMVYTTKSEKENEERRANAIFHLMRGAAVLRQTQNEETDCEVLGVEKKRGRFSSLFQKLRFLPRI